ncbi:MAG: efflux RND transporter periplasmic adaptor subunit [Desulfobacteraceae bacterium]|nr:efflux RND transporter periplasmic adaptor subunit [Desulfobacteraceae bacterium]
MKRPVPKRIIAIAALALIAAAAIWHFSRGKQNAATFQTAAVTRGDLTITISATGTVEPEEVIDVGAQVAGQILSFGKDVDGRTVDYGSHIAAGTVLARIDDSLYVAELANAQAQVKAGQAGLQRAQADLEQYKAKLLQAELDWKRAERLGPSEALAQSSYDAYRSGYETAKANVAVGQAAILQAQADLAQAQANLDRAKRNLGYCTITSPVKGVIIDRRVNIGQTVVASLNAPSLFLIAKDLTRMQVWVAVNEADIGKIKPGQAVTFTVDAFPGETFRGSVGKIRLNASMTQNVVTYTVEIITDNKDGRLLPYLTANVQFELERLTGVLQVPNAALRWTPQADQIDARFRNSALSKEKGGAMAAQNAGSNQGPKNAAKEGGRHMLWTPEGSLVKPIWVQTGATDGLMTAVSGDDLTEGLPIVTGIKTSGESGDTRSPFAPQFPGRGRGQGGQGGR